MISKTELRIKKESLPEFKKRFNRKLVLVLSLIGAIAILLWLTVPDNEVFSILRPVSTMLVLLSFYIARKAAKETGVSYRLILDERGIEKIEPFEDYVFVKWEEANYKQEKNGDILIFNKSLPVSLRTKNRKDVIWVPSQIEHRERLLQWLEEASFQKLY
ncbi:hypothetical protein QNI19_19105 [Cytophagaceae bacterium DM2B3-1]|uniref:YcxB-like protein domain-containing protein n=1 Tax=Xanthocytophaga flava TaxID=3048013 RepID=A0ABT7CMU1_9BACT|nr:hypothetical protein [Xanthocytophaga flavus]MDJ1473469.1 hypothetical protein [Xanthocytophaga flavus]MDJ1495056.1 hypothetical protein [Xanthocytophaga flavus]